MPSRLSDALLHPIDTAVALLRTQGGNLVESGRGVVDAFKHFPVGPDHYVDPDHSDYHLPAGTNVRPVNAVARFAQTGNIVVSVNGNGKRSQLPAKEFQELAHNRREPLDHEAMKTLGGFLRLTRKMSRERALQIMTAVNSPDTSKNPFRTTDTPERATRAAIAAAIKLRETDFFDTSTEIPELLYQARLRLMEAMIGDRRHTFPDEVNFYRPAVEGLLSKPRSASDSLETVA